MAADDKLEWELKFEDAMSGVLGKINSRLDDLDKAMGKLKSNDADKVLGKKAKEAEEKITKALGDAKTKLSGARADFSKAWGEILSVTAPVGARASKALEPMIASLRGVGGRVGGVFSSVLDSHFRPALQRAGEGARRITGPIGRAFSEVANTHFRPFGQRIGEVWGRLSAFGGALSSKLSAFGGSAMRVLGPLGAGFSKVGGAVTSLASAIGTKLGPALSSLGKFGLAGAGALAGVAAALSVAAGAIALSAGKWALSGLAFKEDTLASFKTMLGTEDAAQRVFKQATQFAAATPFSSKEVVDSYQRLLVGGFKEDQLDTIMKAVGDVGSNMGTQNMGGVITALTQIKAAGTLRGGEILQLANAGVGRNAVMEALQRQLGGNKSIAQVMAMQESGKISSDQGIAAVIEAIRTTQSGGVLGSAMEAKGQTLTGLWSSVQDIPSTLLYSAPMDQAMAPLKKMMKGLTDAFKEGSPLFNRATDMFTRVGEAWGKAFEAVGETDVDGILGQIIDAVEKFFVTAAPFAQGFFPALMDSFSKVFDLFGTAGDPEAMKKNGETIAKALGIIGAAVVLFSRALIGVFEKIDKFFADAGDLASRFILNDWRSDKERSQQIDEAKAYERERLRLRKTQGAGSVTASTAGSVDNSVTTTVGQVVVQVQPGDEEAGVKVANRVYGQTPQALTNYATEMGG